MVLFMAPAIRPLTADIGYGALKAAYYYQLVLSGSKCDNNFCMRKAYIAFVRNITFFRK